MKPATNGAPEADALAALRRATAGRHLYAGLAAPLAPHPLRYLRGDGAGPGPRWRAFMLALRAHVQTPDEIADACAGACAAFDRIIALHAAAERAAS